MQVSVSRRAAAHRKNCEKVKSNATKYQHVILILNM
jgi:hypothetical protein